MGGPPSLFEDDVFLWCLEEAGTGVSSSNACRAWVAFVPAVSNESPVFVLLDPFNGFARSSDDFGFAWGGGDVIAPRLP